MNRIPGLAGLVAAVFAASIVAGCASTPPPTEQMAVSKSAIANAVSAGGAEFAPVEMKGAQEKMNRADHAMHEKEYEDARRLAVEAQADARLAEKKAESAKAQKAASVTKDDARVLREELNRKPN